MLAIGPLVLVLLIAVIVYAATHRTPATTPSAAPRREAARDDLSRWVAAGLLSPEQAAAITAYEGTRRAAPAVVRAGRARPAAPAGGRRVPVVAEALGYLGAILATVGLVLIVARYWDDMAVAGRLALSGGGALVLLVAGALVREGADPALARLRGVLWLASAAAAALFAGVLAADGFDVARDETIVAACAGTVALESGLLWGWRERPLQQLAFLVGTLVFAGALVAHVDGNGPVGLTVWCLAAVAFAAGLRRVTPIPLLTEAVGAVALVAGAFVMAVDGWTAFGLLLLVATAFGLLSFATVPQLPTEPVDRRITAVVGGIGLVQAVPSTLGYFAQDAGALTALSLWLVGAALSGIGLRRLVRAPVLAQVLGAAALIGGAALTATQWPGVAPIFGILTALALLALGTLPGNVLLSAFGCIGLLINVPWAIAHFFPGEGRAPLLILVAGLLILGAAVLLTRMGGRFRRELGGPPHAAAGRA